MVLHYKTSKGRVEGRQKVPDLALKPVSMLNAATIERVLFMLNSNNTQIVIDDLVKNGKLEVTTLCGKNYYSIIDVPEEA